MVRLEHELRGARPSMRYVGGDFTAWQTEARAKLKEILGIPLERTEPDLRIEFDRDEEGFREIRFLFASEPDVDVVCHLLLPHGADENNKVPLVICLQGHTTGMHISLGRAKYEKDKNDIAGGDRDFAIQVIRRGQAALTLEQRGFGERGGSESEFLCTQLGLASMLLGRPLVGQRCHDISCAIDLLEEYFPQVDTGCIALLGNSGGGTATIYAAAVEERISAAIPSCAVCGYTESIGLQRHCVCNYVPNIMKYFDMGDLGALVAPRKLIVVNGQNDKIFPIGAANEQYEVTKAAYEAAGCPENVCHIVGAEGHRFYAADTWSVFDKMTEWKKLER